MFDEKETVLELSHMRAADEKGAGEMSTAEWLRGYFQDLFMSDATEGLSPWGEDGELIDNYIDASSGAYVMILIDDDGTTTS